ncbi:MAG: hypothetical protein QG582_124 [Candidatus Thermoplasmatota archaeon]|nr:hypothetical protein [Candidatus Thermoplasmatota archaeon]
MGLISRVKSAIDRDPIILSHHPLCGRFDDHVLKVGGRRVCIGCVTVYPSAVAAALLLLALGQTSFSALFPLALGLFAANLLRFVAKGHRLSALFNAFLGASLAAAILSAVNAPGDLRLAVVVFVLAVASVFHLVKGRRVFKTCRRCPRYQEFPRCASGATPRPADPAE